ncbi:MAG: class I SAM-dependent methyltransferase [Opitutae bacterium]|jgi:2-polyprenyl-3-methyl-5-hydroxy-6-metoxy-1,4-benzoquinol methylase|nr:class I SAM-dependent methyltransferase [Opitutae bacterium]
MVEFAIQDEKISLKRGSIKKIKPAKTYRDAPEETIHEIIDLIETGTPWKEAVKTIVAGNSTWLYNIICHHSRTKFIEEYPLAPSEFILDIGAGWGQMTLPLAKSHRVCSLEPTPERLNFIQSVARQEKVDGNIYFLGADYLDVDFKTRFDRILCIGVLEWVGAFHDNNKPKIIQQQFLKKCKADLKTGGILVIGIENRMGLKYLLGSRDDHIGMPNITCYHEELAHEKYTQATGRELRCLTYSLPEYKEMLQDAGFSKIKFYAATPDYKLPQAIYPIDDGKCQWNDQLNQGNWVQQHDGVDGTLLTNQRELQSHYQSLAAMNMAHYFAPSFYIRAS